MPFNRFDGPIPGQSLTTPPKNAKWEKPPQFTNRDKALDFLMDKLLQPGMTLRLVAQLDGGIPLEGIVRTILMAGFTEGTWSLDLAILIAKPLAGMIATIYWGVTGKQPPKVTFDDGQADMNLVQTMQAVKAIQRPVPVTTQQTKQIETVIKKSGILGAR